MVFSAPEFLFFFLPATLAIYFIAPRRYRNVILMVASLVFYIAGGGVLVVLLLASTVTDYVAGLVVARGLATDRAQLSRAGVLMSLVVNVALLGYYKYANFIVDQINAVAANVGLGQIAWTTILLPIGISFYTFQSMSYTIDVYRQRAEPVRNLWDFTLFVSLFPQLIAGPIVRFHEIHEELISRKTTTDGFAEGAVRFIWGLMKKVVIADSVGLLVDEVFALPGAGLTTATAWIGVLAYTVQIYFDFSGYSDMAIGLGRLFGFHFPENFRRPYSAISITDFWRRWHITLSNWFRDYLYIPLGGSRGSQFTTYMNLGIVFLVTGFWHGANWTFVVWGAYHGVLLIIERVSGQRLIGEGEKGTVMRRGLTFFAVVVGWVLFRADGLTHAWQMFEAMFTFRAGGLPPEVSLVMTTRAQIALVIGLSAVFLPRNFVGGIWVIKSSTRLATAGRVGLALLALPYSLALVSSGSFSPFLYYQF